jgi:aminopeptidase N
MDSVRRLIQTFTPEHYSLSLDIDRSARAFKGVVAVEGISTSNVISLHAKDLVIQTVTVDGHQADFVAGKDDELTITYGELQAGKHIVTVSFAGKINDHMHGMYPCYFEHDGVKKELIATQFESHHAREVFPCVDEPEAKATYDVTLTTETGITVLSNMAIHSQQEEENRLVTTFQRTPRMSSYLLAWVYGEMHSVHGTTKGGVEVNIWATPAQSADSLDFALDIATRTIDFFDEYFGVPYPLPKSDHVALPDFSSGAMENWGLITYREVALLADPKTISISSKRYIATVIAHELSHQWFGNLVTMKWWNNLWLNESFANLMEYIAVDALHPEWNIWLDYSSHETIMALRRDALDGVQAVQTEVNHPDEISTLFDGAIVYAKGGRLLRMLQHYIGHEAFQAGLKNYFKKYAYQNTEGDDLWSELSATSGKDITDFMNTWISQPGYPVVHVTNDGLRQEQFFVGSHEKSNRIWPIPLEASVPITPPLMETPSLATTIEHGERLNVGDTAHFITNYTPEHMAELIVALNNNALKPIDRLQLLHEQTMLARGEVISSAKLIPLLQAYSSETIESVWDIISLALGELKKFVETDESSEKKLRELSRTISAEQFNRLGWTVRAGESETDTKLRATILGMTLYGEQPEVLNKANELYDQSKVSELEPETRALIIGAKVRHFSSDELIDQLLTAYKTTSSAELQGDISSGLTSTKDAGAIQKLLAVMKDSETVRSQDVFRWFVYLIRNKYARDAAWQWTKDNWGWIEETFGGDKSFDDFPRYAASGLVTREQLEDYKAFFIPKMEIPALKRVIQLGIGEIEGRVTLIERDQAEVRQALLELDH